MTFSQTGIVIKRHDYKEFDRLVVVFSQSGKRTFLAKGVRKSTSRRGSHFEPGTLLQFQYIEKTVPLITETKLIKSHRQLQVDLKAVTFLYQFLEILDLFILEGQDSAAEFQVAIDGLNLLSEGRRREAILSTAQKLLNLSGFVLNQEYSEQELLVHLESISHKKLHAKSFLHLDTI